MTLSSNTHELLCVLLLGLGIVLLMSGYDTSSFISESVMHSIHTRLPEQIDEYAGYYGPTVMYGTYCIFSLLSPYICYNLGAKWTIFAGSVPFTLFLANYFYLHSFTYYFAQALLGIGFALFYSGQGQYLSEHSTRETISRNSVMMSAIGNQSMLAGGLILALITLINPPKVQESLGESTHIFRDFSESEVFVIFGVLLLASILSNILFAFLPIQQHNSLAQLEPPHKATFNNQIGLVWGTLSEPRILCLLPFFVFYGLHISFWLIIFPTSFAFSHHLSHNHFLPALYSIAVSIGNIFIGFYIHFMSKRNNSFGLVPTMITQIFLTAFVYLLTILSTPNMSTIIPTKEDAFFFQPTVWIVLLIGILHGMADCCSSTMRSFVCTIAVPKKRLQAYSVAKLFQSLATCVGTFFSPQFTICSWIVLLIVAQLLSCLSFYTVCRSIRKEENKVLPVKA